MVLKYDSALKTHCLHQKTTTPEDNIVLDIGESMDVS